MLGRVTSIDTGISCDIKFVIDATASMEPLIEAVKELTLGLKDKINKGLAEKYTTVSQLRVQIIVFRDFYVDDKYALQESGFFVLPEQEQEFRRFVSEIKCGGGGDEPESSLEALAAALRSDWVKDSAKLRHIICLFTDAAAHPLEMQSEGVPDCYPEWMFKNISELYTAWGNGQTAMYRSSSEEQMNRSAKRLIMFAPKQQYPWEELDRELENSWIVPIDKGNGGKDISTDEIISVITKSV